MYQSNNCLYEFEGPFIFRVLDNNNFMVLETNQQKIIFFGFNKEKELILIHLVLMLIDWY